MSDEKLDDEEKKKKDKKEKHPFDLSIEERRRLGLSDNTEYFERVEKHLQNSKKLKEKPDREKNRIKAMLIQKENEIKKLKSGQNKEALALAQADKKFLKTALRVLPSVKREISRDIIKLEFILTTKIKMSYQVLSDFALKPIPSQRRNAKDKDNDKNKNKNKDKNKKQNGDKGPSKNTKSPEEIEKSKKSQHLYNLTRKGRNDKLTPLKKKRRLRSNRSPQKALQYAPSKDTGR